MGRTRLSRDRVFGCPGMLSSNGGSLKSPYTRIQHAFENLEEAAKDGIVDELLNQGATVFGEVAKSQWGSYCVQHSRCSAVLSCDAELTLLVLEHGSENHRGLALEHLISGLLEYATNEQGAKSVTKALKEGGKDTLNRIIKRMCEPAKGSVYQPFSFSYD